MGLFRLLLAISIVIAHSSPILGLSLVGGRVAVETFFLLSGFYMSLVLSEKYQKKLKLFYKNRFLKIFPQYWFFLLICIVIGLLFGAAGNAFFKYHLSLSSKIYLFFLNLTPIGQDITNFLAYNSLNGSLFFTATFRAFKPEIWNFLILPQTWTISLELFFYLLVPWLNRQKTKTLLFICCLSLIFRLILILVFHLNFDPWEYRFFPNELLFFVSGIIVYRLYKILNLKTKFVLSLPLFIFLLFYQYIPHQTIKMLLFYCLTFLTIPFLFKLSKNSKLDRLLGEISYPLYLSHFLVINLYAQIFLVNQRLLGLITLITCLPLSFMVYFLFQKPIDSYRQKQLIKL